MGVRSLKKFSLILALVLALGLIMVACGNNTEETNNTSNNTNENNNNNENDGNEADRTDWVENVTILTGGEAGTYFPVGVAMGEIMDGVDGVSASGISSGASVVNVNELSDGNGEFGLVQNDVAFYATEGSHMFDSVVDGYSGVFTIYPETIQIITQADSGIETVDDLVGKRVAVGDIGSGTEANASQILEAHGISYDDINEEWMGFGDASSNIQDGNIDAAFVTSGTPTGSIQELSANTDIRIVTITDDKIDQLVNQYPYYTRVDISADEYENFDSTASTVAVQAMLIVRDDLPADQVYELTKSIFENLDVMIATHARGNDLTLDTALDGMSIPVHPGAQRYYDEQ